MSGTALSSPFQAEQYIRNHGHVPDKSDLPMPDGGDVIIIQWPTPDPNATNP
jgi:hypothetical protein